MIQHSKICISKMTFLIIMESELTNVVATIPAIPPRRKFFTLWLVEVALTVGTFGTVA